MARSIGISVLLGAVCVALLSACVQVTAPGGSPTTAPTGVATLEPSGAPSPSRTVDLPATPTAGASANAAALLPDPDADYTTGDTARLSGGEFVGDQADLTVLETIMGASPEGAADRYSFLVEITGLDPDTFPYNLRDFRLIDDQSFQYEPLFEGGQAPRLEFGDLAPEQQVRGWLTFEIPHQSSTVELQYSPALALESATFGFLVP